MTFPNQGSSQTFFKNRVKKREELPADRQRTQKIVIRKTAGNTENNGGLDTMKETQELNRLFKDSDMDCNEENVACGKGDADMIGKNDDNIENPDTASSDKTEGIEEIEEIEEDDLIFHPLRRQAVLPVGKYHAVIKDITAESREGMYGTFKSIRIRFQIFHDERQVVVNFLAQKDLKPSGKLFKMLKMILGEAPSDGFNLRDLKGEKVVVEVGHRLDSNGDTWEEVLSAVKYSG